MRSFQKKGRIRHIMQSKIFLIFLGIIILISLYTIFGFMNRMEETTENKRIIEDKITELEKSKEIFSSEIEKLKKEIAKRENG